MEKTKICKDCKRELPLNKNYFYVHNKYKDGFEIRCRECCGSKFLKTKEGYKICSTCRNELPATKEYFNVSKMGKYGFSSNCKICAAEATRIWKQENSEQAKQSNNKWKAENKEHIIKYREDNKEKSKEYNKVYYIQNKIKRNENAKQWRLRNPEKKKIIDQNRRSRKRQLIATLTESQWENIKKYFNYTCVYCGEEKPLTQDHFIPVTKGGEYTHNNIIPSCKSCNSSKGNKDFFNWYPKYKYYSKEREELILNFFKYNKPEEVEQIIT